MSARHRRDSNTAWLAVLGLLILFTAAIDASASACPLPIRTLEVAEPIVPAADGVDIVLQLYEHRPTGAVPIS
ncbi:MAG: hypothetical protein AAGM22_33660, partial [Acidobacteriota bacterium]